MKLYPFSVKNHAHDIEFRYNRVKNTFDDYFSGKIELSDSEFDRLEELEEELRDLNEAMFNSRDGRIVYLTGPQIGLAKETVLWASNARAGSMIAAGKTEYLKYC